MISQRDLVLEDYSRNMRGDAWYGDAVWSILDGVSAKCAGFRVAPDVHTIWELVMHMTYWEGVITVRAKAPVTESPERNFPEVADLSEAQWQQTVEEFRASNYSFEETMAGVDQSRWHELTPGGKRSFHEDAVGITQHHTYHAGQIALLKKAFNAHRRAGL